MITRRPSVVGRQSLSVFVRAHAADLWSRAGRDCFRRHSYNIKITDANSVRPFSVFLMFRKNKKINWNQTIRSRAARCSGFDIIQVYRFAGSYSFTYSYLFCFGFFFLWVSFRFWFRVLRIASRTGYGSTVSRFAHHRKWSRFPVTWYNNIQVITGQADDFSEWISV